MSVGGYRSLLFADFFVAAHVLVNEFFFEISTSFVVSSILLIDVGWHAAKQGKLRAHVRASSRLCCSVRSCSQELLFESPCY